MTAYNFVIEAKKANSFFKNFIIHTPVSDGLKHKRKKKKNISGLFFHFEVLWYTTSADHMIL